MKRVLARLVVTGCGVAIAYLIAAPHLVPDRGYSIAEVTVGLRLHPQQWSGRVVRVHGWLASKWQTCNAPYQRCRLVQWQTIQSWSPYTRFRPEFWSSPPPEPPLALAGMLVVTGAQNYPWPAEPALYHVYNDLSHLPLVDHFIAGWPVPDHAAVYRVRLLAHPGWCRTLPYLERGQAHRYIAPCPDAMFLGDG